MTAMDLSIRPLRRSDLAAAEHIWRLAFGTFLGLPDPQGFRPGASVIATRWAADPDAVFGAELGGEVVGSNVATNWGSVGLFGPLSVRPDLWDRGIATRLLEPVLDRFSAWGTAHAGLFTFPQSARHIHLYQKFGFWPRFLTPIMAKPVSAAPSPTGAREWSRYRALAEAERVSALRACREVADALYDGLDLSQEIRAAQSQGIGDTVLLWDAARLVGFAVCHLGAGSEAGAEACYVKFGTVRPGPGAAQAFDRLLDACEAIAAAEGLGRLVVGVNTARHEAYRALLGRGFRTETIGLAMQRPNEAGYQWPDAYVVDDWR